MFSFLLSQGYTQKRPLYGCRLAQNRPEHSESADNCGCSPPPPPPPVTCPALSRKALSIHGSCPVSGMITWQKRFWPVSPTRLVWRPNPHGSALATSLWFLVLQKAQLLTVTLSMKNPVLSVLQDIIRGCKHIFKFWPQSWRSGHLAYFSVKTKILRTPHVSWPADVPSLAHEVLMLQQTRNTKSLPAASSLLPWPRQWFPWEAKHSMAKELLSVEVSLAPRPHFPSASLAP